LLRAQEADELLEQASVPPVRDYNLDLAVLVTAETGDDTELQQKLLDVGRQLLASGGIADLNRLPRQERRRAIALEQRPQEERLEGRRAVPDEARDLLVVAPLTDEHSERTGAERIQILHVELMEQACRFDRPRIRVAPPADHAVIGGGDLREIICVDVVEA